MARFTERYGLSYFGGGVPGNITEDGAKFTSLDPQLLDKLLGALEDHDHSGGEQLVDPSEAPTMEQSEVGGTLPGGRTYHYAVTFLDRYGLETVASDEVDVLTPAPVAVPASPSLEADSGTVTRDAFFSSSTTIRMHAPVPHDNTGMTSTCDICQQPVVKVDGAWKHTDPNREFLASDVGRQISVVGLGAGSTTLIAKIVSVNIADHSAVIDIAPTVAANTIVTRPLNIERGGLPAEYHQYALSVLVYVADSTSTFTQETTLSVPVPITPPANGVVTVTLPDMPDGGDAFRVWRKSIRDQAYTKVGVVGPDTDFVDDGSVKADPCACTPENQPPAYNTTNGTNRVTITVNEMDQDTLTDPGQKASAWRLYRTETSGIYRGTSLVAEIPRAADGTFTFSYIDTGEDLLPGRPPLVSNTISPSQPIPIGHGELPTLPDNELTNFTPWIAPNGQIYMLTVTNNVQAWTPVLSLPIPDSITNEHVAADAAIDMAKLALGPLLSRVDALEDAGGGGGSGTDATSVHYRGDWTGQAYAVNDLVRHDGGLYLSPTSQAGPSTTTARSYDQQFETDGTFTDPEVDLRGGVWNAIYGRVRLSVLGQPVSPFNAYPMLFDSDRLDHDVITTSDNNGTTYLFVGVSDDRTSGYLATQSNEFVSLYRFYAGNIEQVTYGQLEDPVNARMRLQLTEGAPGNYHVAFTDNGSLVCQLTETPSFTAGTWVGFGPDKINGPRYEEFVVSPPANATPPAPVTFDVTKWIELVAPPTAVDARLDALEARAALALHYRDAFAAGQDYYVNDLVVQGGVLYRSTVDQPAATSFDSTLWTVFPPSS